MIEELMINSCTCSSPKTWVMLICCLKGIVLTFGVFLSWETRNVHCLQPNDSRNTGLAVYNVFMFSCLALVVMFVETYPPIEMLIERTIVFVGTTSTICLLFLPKVRKILVFQLHNEKHQKARQNYSKISGNEPRCIEYFCC